MTMSEVHGPSPPIVSSFPRSFNFWGDFSRAMDNYLTMTTKEDAKPKPSGVVTMSIVQPKSDCTNDKSHPCPKQ